MCTNSLDYVYKELALQKDLREGPGNALPGAQRYEDWVANGTDDTHQEKPDGRTLRVGMGEWHGWTGLEFKTQWMLMSNA